MNDQTPRNFPIDSSQIDQKIVRFVSREIRGIISSKFLNHDDLTSILIDHSRKHICLFHFNLVVQVSNSRLYKDYVQKNVVLYLGEICTFFL